MTAERRARVFAIGSSLLVLAAVGLALSVLESPGGARMRRLDDRRLFDLRLIAEAVEKYRRTHDGVPAGLADLRMPTGAQEVPVQDPETQAPYEYRPQGANAYELCAQFQTTLDARSDDNHGNAFWYHGPGRTCFRIEVRPPVKP